MRRSLVMVLLALMPLVSRADGYVCTIDMATGFAYTGGAWTSSRFAPDQKFVVRREAPGESFHAKWLIFKAGEALPHIMCSSNDFDSTGNLVCKDHLPTTADATFKMNRDSLRFLYAYLEGYWD